MALIQPYGNNPGRIIGGVTLGQSGPLTAGGGAFTFDGATGLVGTQRRFANPSMLSILFWVKLASQTGAILGLNGGEPFALSSAYTYVYLLSTPLIGFTPNNTAINGVAGATIPPLGVWTMIVALSNGTGYTLS